MAENDAEAAEWYRRASDQGHASAQFNLGILYANRDGVAQSYVKSYVWIYLAAMSGGGNMESKLDRAAEKLTTGELEQARQRSAKMFKEIQRQK